MTAVEKSVSFALIDQICRQLGVADYAYLLVR